MTSPTVDRRFGLVGNTALKAPVAAVATSNITLSGQQTIDGVAVLASNASSVPDRVLCVGQTTTSQNGIWDVSTASWTRSKDANGPYDLTTGTQVLVAGGTLYVRTVWCLTTASPITVGTTALTWQLAIGSSLGNFLQAGTGAVARTFTSKNRDIVSAKDFGVVGDGVTDDTANLRLFLAAATRGYIPAGTYKITGKLTFLSNQVITGDGPATIIKYAAVAPPASDPVLNLLSISNTRVSELTLQVPVTYTTARSILMDTCTNCHVSDILFSGGAGGNAAYLTASTRCSVSRCYVDDYRSNGFYVTGGYGNVIDDNDIPDGSGGLMGIQFVGGESNTASNNRLAKMPDNYFGIHLYGGNFPVAIGNSIKNTRREALAIGGTTQIGARVINNTMYWDTNLGVGDFGMSVTGNDVNNLVTDFLIEGNTIIQSAFSGIGIAGWAQRGRIVNNVLRNCCYAGSATYQGAIKLYGWVAGAVVNDMVVEGNSIAKFLGGMLYAVTEDNGLGAVSANVIRGNKAYGLSGEIYPITTSSMLALNDTDLTTVSYTSTITASVGTVTTATGTLQYQRVGKFMVCKLTITITTNGTGATGLICSLPFTATGGVLTGAEVAVTGKACKAGPSGGGAQLTITNYDNTYPGANGVSLSLTGVLTVA